MELDANLIIVVIQVLTLGGVASLDRRIRRIAHEEDGPLLRRMKALRSAIFTHTHDQDGDAVVSVELRESLNRPLVESAKDVA